MLPVLLQTVHEVALEQLDPTTTDEEALTLTLEFGQGVAENSPAGSVTTQHPDEIFAIVGAVPSINPVILALDEHVPWIFSS